MGGDAIQDPCVTEQDFDTWCRRELFTEDMVLAEGLLQDYCDGLLTCLYRQLRLYEYLDQPSSAQAVAQELGMVSSADVAIDAMLHRLADRTNVVVEDSDVGPRRFVAHEMPSDSMEELRAIRTQMESLGDSYCAALDFLDLGADHFVEALRDDPEFMDRILAGRESKYMNLWDRATNLDPLQNVHGRMGARAVSNFFEGGRVLEVGGGTGNGIRHVLHELNRRRNSSQLSQYVFTDISTGFVVQTRRMIRSSFPDAPCDWRFLDINRSFSEQGYEPESVDLIYGVNAAHVAKDIVGTLGFCLDTLRPGGRVLFAERIRTRPGEMAPRELTLNLCEYHRTAAQRDPECRLDHAYLSAANWERALARAGFGEVAILPSPNGLRSVSCRYAAVVSGIKLPEE